MQTEKTYEIRPGLLMLARGSGYLFLAAAVAAGAYSAFYPEELPRWLAVICVGVLGGFAYLGLVCVRAPAFYTLILTAEGIRQLGPEIFVPWSQVSGLRERSCLGRVDVLHHGGGTGVAVEYGMKGFGDILKEIASRAPAPEQATRHEFERAPSVTERVALVFVTLCALALGVWCWLAEAHLEAVFPALVMASASICDHYTMLRSVEIRADEIVLTRGRRRQRIDLRSVQSVEFTLRTSGQISVLDVLAVSFDGSTILLRPTGVDAFDLYRVAARACAAAQEGASSTAWASPL